MEELKPVKIVFDTDIGVDCDDAGALALIHRLCDKGEAELLAVTHCYNGAYYAGCIDAINRFFGREVPIGINYADKPQKNTRGVYAAELCEHFENSFPSNAYQTKDGPMDTLALLRKTLSEADDNSITFVATGTLSSMARLILSEPDEICSLSGKELVTKKLNRTVLMGGRFFESWPMIVYESGEPTHHIMTWEYNIRGSGYEVAKSVFDNWNGELVLSSYEIGAFIHTMTGYAKRSQKDDPVARAYQLYSNDTGRCSWDHTAVLEAIRPGVYWNSHEYGKISVDKEMVTNWMQSRDHKHTYLLPKANYEEIRQVLDDLLDGK